MAVNSLKISFLNVFCQYLVARYQSFGYFRVPNERAGQMQENGSKLNKRGGPNKRAGLENAES